MANSWLEGNIARTQSAIQARDAASQARKRGSDTFLSSLQTGVEAMKPFTQAQAEVQKQEALYGEGGKDIFGNEKGPGVARKFQTDIMDKEAKIASEAEKRNYFETTGLPAVNEKGNLTDAFITWKYGYDPKLQRDRFSAERRKELGGIDEWMVKTIEDYGSTISPFLLRDPETGEVVGYKPEDKETLVTFMTAQLQESDLGRWYGFDERTARAKVTRIIDQMKWGQVDEALNAVPSDDPAGIYEALTNYKPKIDLWGSGEMGHPRASIGPGEQKRLDNFQKLVSESPAATNDPAVLYAINKIAQDANAAMNPWPPSPITGPDRNRILDDAEEKVRALLSGKTLGDLRTSKEEQAKLDRAEKLRQQKKVERLLADENAPILEIFNNPLNKKIDYSAGGKGIKIN